MPKPYRSTADSSLVWGTQILQHRQDHAYFIGLITAEWAFLESELVAAFSTLMGTQEINEFNQFTHTGNSLAGVALECTFGLPPRLKIIKAAINDKLSTQDETIFIKLLDAITQAGHKRNAVAHGLWAADSAIPDVVILRGRNGAISYTVDDFQETLTLICQTTAQLNEFINKLLEDRHLDLKQKT